jgi:hypothetical protein
MAASKFARVFELAAPDAPGLVGFGAQFDPAAADLCMPEVRWSASAVSVFPCKKHFRDASTRGSSISVNCKAEASRCLKLASIKVRPASWLKVCCGSCGRPLPAGDVAGCSISRRISAYAASRPFHAGRTAPVFRSAFSARPQLDAAARSAIAEMCQIELADAVIATKRNERGDAPPRPRNN